MESSHFKKNKFNYISREEEFWFSHKLWAKHCVKHFKNELNNIFHISLKEIGQRKEMAYSGS